MGDHSEEWFNSRGPLARKVVEEMKEQGVLVFAGGLVEEIELAIGVDEKGRITEPVSSNEFLAGLTIVDIETEEDAKAWVQKLLWPAGGLRKLVSLKTN